MTYAIHRGHFAPYFTHTPSRGSSAVVREPGVWRRIFDAIVESRQRSIDREIARQLYRSGGRLTDSIEREIMENVMTGNWKVRD